ncbi:MAG: TIGR03986 family CRISPR-associated RAMP protein [Anaerosomatales bacterium]|nr:TIGR03986 family CRISPR-associated RAMP protein [Anaerosomatales bacterium]
MPAMFHNPYTFIPRLPRKQVLADPDLGDARPTVDGKPKNVAPPRWHHKLFDEQWTGTIRLRLRTETPLLICDAQHAVAVEGTERSDHRAYPARVDTDGKPYIPATTLKGAISTAYEIITNSRYRVIDEALWGSRLAYRSATDETRDLKPVRIVKDAEGRFRVQILQAARVHMYPRPGNVSWRDFENGDRVWIRLDRGKVCEMVRATGPKPPGMHEGWLLRTGRTMDTKKHERVFYIGQTREEAEIPDNVAKAYNDLLANYHSIHQEELAAGSTGPSAAQDAEWGYHVKKLQSLEEGHLCWARTKQEHGRMTVKELRPVMISRKIYEQAPENLVPDNLKPARSIEELSPAERLFGWTAPEGKGAFRGKLRIGRVRCLAEKPEDAIDSFPHPGVPLAILGQPKPQQERFYVAKDKNGTPLDRGVERGTGYGSDGSGLRGYKVYPHHRVPDGYWDDPMSDRTRNVQGGWAQEYRRPDCKDGAQRDNQNRSVTSWVKPGVEFEVDVHVTNLTGFELGALLWLFSMEEGACFRMGGGKPLGFGSVRIDWVPEASTLMRGSEWRAHWRELGKAPSRALEPEEADELKDAFETRVREKFQLAQHRNADFLRAFVLVSKGFEDRLPVHYPRAVAGTQPAQQQIPQNPEGENFKWFVANERWNRHDPQQQHLYSLPHVLLDRGLPILPADPPPRGNRGNQHRHQHGRGGRR